MDTAPVRFFPALLSVAAVILIETAARHFSGDPLAVTGAARVIQILAILIIFYGWDKRLSVFGFQTDFFHTGVYKGVIWSLGFAAATGLAALLLYGAGLSPAGLVHVRLPHSTGRLVLFYFVAGIVGPIAEEMFFRGIIYGYFRDLLHGVLKKRIIAVAMAVAAVTFLFVAAHSHVSALPVPQIAGGILFCLSYEVEKNLMVPIIIHSLGNMALFTLSLFL